MRYREERFAQRDSEYFQATKLDFFTPYGAGLFPLSTVPTGQSQRASSKKKTGFSVVERQMLTDVETRPLGKQLGSFLATVCEEAPSRHSWKSGELC